MEMSRTIFSVNEKRLIEDFLRFAKLMRLANLNNQWLII